MFTIVTFTTFLGWCSVINIGILALSTVGITVMREPIMKIHASLLGLDQSMLPKLYFQYLGNFKIAVIMLNIVPYIALKIMF